MLPRPPMLTIKNRVAFKLLLAVLFAGILAGCKPPGPKALLDGKYLIEKGRFPEAIERLQVATELLGTNAQPWNYLGVAYHQAGQPSNAVTAYRRALTINPDLIEARLNLGTLWLELGRAAEAKSEFTAYTLRRANDPAGFLKLASAELRLRETTQAEAHARRALQLDDADPDAWNALGLIQLQRGRSRDAVQSFLGALKCKADFSPATLNLAILSQQTGDRATALQWYKKYLALKPRPADADAVSIVVRQLELELTARPAPEPAQPAVKPTTTNPTPAQPPPPPTVALTPATNPEPPQAKPAVVARQPVLPPPTVVTVAPEPQIRITPVAPPPVETAQSPSERPAKVIASEPAPAVAVPKEEKRGFLQSINPMNLFRRETKPQRVTPLPGSDVSLKAEPPSVSASATASAPKPVEVTDAPSASSPSPASVGSVARYVYRGGGSATPGDRAAAQRFAELGLRAMQAKRFAEANAAYRSAVAADPGWFQAHFNHAVTALEAGQTSEALAAGETALALEPDSAGARYNFALALKRGNYFVDAAVELERLLAKNPGEARAHLTLANLYAEQLRQPDKARAHYLKVLELEPRHPQAGAINFWLRANPRK